MKKILNLLAVTLLAFSAQAKMNVVATTPDLGAIAQEIGGDKIELTTLAKPTEDPHFVDAKPSFVVKLNRADALIEGGAELRADFERDRRRRDSEYTQHAGPRLFGAGARSGGRPCRWPNSCTTTRSRSCKPGTRSRPRSATKARPWTRPPCATTRQRS